MIINDILHSFLRSGLAFILLLVSTRFMGRKSISQMTFFDFVVSITLGSLGANLAMGSSPSLFEMAAALLILALLAFITDVFHIKSLKFSKLVQSEPVVLIENGKINTQNMKKIRFNITDLSAQLREKNAFNIADVEFAILECDGKLSVLPKSQKQPLTPSHLNIPTAYVGLTRDIVIDGKIMLENLKDVNLDEGWLNEQLKVRGKSSQEVFYAGLDTSGNLYVSEKRSERENHGRHGIE